MTRNHPSPRELMDFIAGESGAEDREDLMSHLKNCPSCRVEESRLRKMLAATSAEREEARRVMETVDWEALAQRIADAAERRTVPARARTEIRPGFFGWLRRPALAYLLVGLVLGGLGMFVVLRSGLMSPSPRMGYMASQDFLDKAELELARRATLTYLERSQYLLLDFAQAPPDQAAAVWQRDFASAQAADLLARKKYLDPQLGKVPMAKARAICDQIEVLFLELSQMSGQLDGAEWREIQERVEQSQLLLKINLVKKELESREI
jgi:hypothetical protein